MNKKSLLFSAALFLILSATIGLASAQSNKETNEAEGQAAEKAGRLREALTHYVAALQSVSEGSADDQRLRETIIKLVQRLTPPPALPEEAERYMGRGLAAVEIAKGPEDFTRAIAEFKKALRIAPWLADGYFNLGVVQEKAGLFNGAIRSYRLYLLAAPSTPDAQQVRTRIFGLEYKAEREKEETAKAEQQRMARQREEEARTTIQGLAGNWISDEGTDRYVITVSGSSIEIVYSEMYNPVRKEWLHWRQYGFSAPPQTWRGNMEKLQIRGTFTQLQKPGGPVFTFPFTATISPDGTRIQLNYEAVAFDGSKNRWEKYLVRR